MAEENIPSKKTEIVDLQSIKIAIGDAMQLQDFSPAKQRHYVKLIGYLNRRSVIVSHPMLNDKLMFVKEGESFLVRGFSGTKTFDFTANVIAVCLTPYAYLHLSFPAQVNTINMRAALRVRVKLVCSVEVTSSTLKLPATIEDMSVSGLRIQAKKSLGEVGDEINVSFRLPIEGVEQLFIVPAVIRNVLMDDENAAVVHGVSISQPEGNERMALQNFIYKTMTEG